MTATPMLWDAVLRGAAAAFLLFHLVYLLGSALPRASRWALAAFVASILAYLLCSHAVYANLPWWISVPALSLCLLSTPLLWLAMLAVFDDGFAWSAKHLAILLAALLGGWMAVKGVGGDALALGFKLLLMACAAATLWSVLRHWYSDLVSPRRLLRAWVAGGLGAYTLLVLSVEAFYIGQQTPAFLSTMHLAGITLTAGVLALVVAHHPLEQWLRADHLAQANTAAAVIAPSSLTRAPPAIDRKAALQERLLHAMGAKRVYAQEGLNVNDLATQLDASPAQLRQAINQQLGYRNFNDFLHHYRIDEAAQRLLVQDLPILTIALDVGYASIGPFNRAFKLRKGLTPSEFRASTSA